MAADMIKAVLAAENAGKEMEKEALKAAEKMLSDAKIQADIIVKTAVEQAEREANIILSDAEYSSVGIVKQAEKLAELRERKSIADTEKLYEKAIKMIFDELLS
ncbi:MAG: hypothetical protein IJB74_06685 [Clostridia bacterium]|nr:hypothetical protein [Clostridia bacterium]